MQKKHDLKVIYDAAHAFGIKYKGRGIASYGDASIFSFHATKVFNTIEGGAVCFQNQSFGNRLERLKNFGIKNEEEVDQIGANAKMNEFEAAMGICNLRYIDEEIAKRKRVYERYMENLDGVKGLQLRRLQDNVVNNYVYFPIVVSQSNFCATRNEIQDALKKENIFARKYFWPITYYFDCYKGRFDAGKTPVAMHIGKRVLTLPMYADLELETVDKISEIIHGLKN